jgi:hypothetical protein
MTGLKTYYLRFYFSLGGHYDFDKQQNSLDITEAF